jgi:hypothetical protein
MASMAGLRLGVWPRDRAAIIPSTPRARKAGDA